MSAGDTHSGGETAVHGSALQEEKTPRDLNVTTTALGGSDRDELACIKVHYEKCSPLDITELIVKRAKSEAPGARLAMTHLWRAIIGKLGADAAPLEELWVEADLDPTAGVASEDWTKAHAAVEEALAPCRVCVVDLKTLLEKIVRRAVVARKPNGELVLAVDLEYNGQYAFVATKLSAWRRKTKDGGKYVVPDVLVDNLQQLGIEVEADPIHILRGLMVRAERYETVIDAYLRPILQQVLEKLRVAPHLAKCTRDGRVLYIAAELFRSFAWFFNANVGLGRNALYESLRRLGLLAASSTMSIYMTDEYGRQIKKRALPFDANRLSDFVEFDVAEFCRWTALLAGAVEDGGEEQQTDRDDA
jgi:hypothetical protein